MKCGKTRDKGKVCVTIGLNGFSIQPTSNQFTARAYHRTRSVKLARTIADLAESDEIQLAHMAEVLKYRPTIMMWKLFLEIIWILTFIN